MPSALVCSLWLLVLSCPLPICGLSRDLDLHAHCTHLSSAGTCINMSLLSCPLQTPPLTARLHSSALYRNMQSHAHCPHLVTEGSYSHMPTASLWHLQAISLIWTVSLCPGQAPALTYHCPFSPLHVSTLTRSLPSLASAGTSTQKQTDPLCPLQAPVPTYPLLPSDLCGHLYLYVHSTLVSADT